MSLSQMKHEAKYQIFIPRIWCFWHLLYFSGRMHWLSMGYKLSNVFSINNFRGVRIMLAQRQRAKQQFYKHSKWKRLIQVEIENRLFPYMFNSKEDNLGQIEFETVWWDFMIKYRCGLAHRHLHKTLVQRRMSFAKVKASFGGKYRFSIKGHNSIMSDCKTVSVCALQR